MGFLDNTADWLGDAADTLSDLYDDAEEAAAAVGAAIDQVLGQGPGAQAPPSGGLVRPCLEYWPAGSGRTGCKTYAVAPTGNELMGLGGGDDPAPDGDEPDADGITTEQLLNYGLAALGVIAVGAGLYYWRA